MNYKISKELFKAVMNYNHKLDSIIVSGKFVTGITNTSLHKLFINDFFFKCKEWALKQGYEIFTSGIKCSVYEISKGWIIDQLESTSEQQAVFDACQLIIDRIVPVLNIKGQRMTSNDYLTQLKEMQQNANRAQYSYKLYLRQGQDYIYQCDLTREQFEIHRKANNEEYCFGGIHSMRDSTISSESMLETRTYYNIDNERHEVWKGFLEAFIFENGITKVEEFKEFIYEFVIIPEFSRTNYSNNAKLVSELDKKYINLYKDI